MSGSFSKAGIKLNGLLALTGSIEAVTGLALLVDPAIVTRLLLGVEVSGVAIALGRVAGFGLLSLGLASVPRRNAAGDSASAFRAMLTYNLLDTLYLLYLGIGGEWVGRLLWPAVVLHGALTLLLAGTWFRARKTAVH